MSRQRIIDLFHRASDLRPAEQATFLERHCADCPELAEEVRQLLVADAAVPLTFLRPKLGYYGTSLKVSRPRHSFD